MTSARVAVDEGTAMGAGRALTGVEGIGAMAARAAAAVAFVASAAIFLLTFASASVSAEMVN